MGRYFLDSTYKHYVNGNNAWNKHSKEYGPEAANAIYGNRGGSGATGTPSQAIPNDRNVASAADTLLSDPKYN